MSSNKPGHIRLTSHPEPLAPRWPLRWGAAGDPTVGGRGEGEALSTAGAAGAAAGHCGGTFRTCEACEAYGRRSRRAIRFTPVGR